MALTTHRLPEVSNAWLFQKLNAPSTQVKQHAAMIGVHPTVILIDASLRREGPKTEDPLPAAVTKSHQAALPLWNKNSPADGLSTSHKSTARPSRGSTSTPQPIITPSPSTSRITLP